MRRRVSVRGRVRPSVRPSVGLSVGPSPVIFVGTLGTSCAVYLALLDATTYIYERYLSVVWSVCRSIRLSPVIFEGDKYASCAVYPALF